MYLERVHPAFLTTLVVLVFLNLENGLFQTHPPTKSGKFQIFFFFEPFPNAIKYQFLPYIPLISVIFVMKGKYREIEDRGKTKRCMAACNDQTFRVTSSSNSFPGKESYSHRKSFCTIVR